MHQSTLIVHNMSQILFLKYNIYGVTAFVFKDLMGETDTNKFPLINQEIMK